MFRTVFPSITRSSKLRIQQQVYVKQLLLLSGTRWNRSSISSPIAAGSSGCLTYTCCCIHNFELLVMDGKTVRNVERFTRTNNLRDRWILLVTLWEYITMHGPINVKYTCTPFHLYTIVL